VVILPSKSGCGALGSPPSVLLEVFDSIIAIFILEFPFVIAQASVALISALWFCGTA